MKILVASHRPKPSWARPSVHSVSAEADGVLGGPKVLVVVVTMITAINRNMNDNNMAISVTVTMAIIGIRSPTWWPNGL